MSAAHHGDENTQMTTANAQPRISVVTPSFNQATFLESTIRSVLEQSYQDVEYIIIDGESTDGSIEIIKRYATQLAYWCAEKDQGQAHAIAKGFAKSTGDILCWLNSDDTFTSGALAAVAEYFTTHPRADAVSAGAYLVDAGGNPHGTLPCSYTLGVRATYNRFRIYGQEGVYQQATFWRREAYFAAGGIDPSLTFIMDLDLFARLACLKRFGRLPQLVACFRQHEAAKSSLLSIVHDREFAAFQLRHVQPTYPSIIRHLLHTHYKYQSKLRRLLLVALRALHLTGPFLFA